MFLVNGVMLQGRIAAYDLFCMLLEREGYVQLAYKHAVSTIQPASAGRPDRRVRRRGGERRLSFDDDI